MLQKENRLKKRKEFKYIYGTGKSVYSKYITIVFTPTKLEHCKVGFSVSKKIGKAYERNKVKRRLREIIRLNFNQLNGKYNYIIVAKTGIVVLNFNELKDELLQLINKVNMK